MSEEPKRPVLFPPPDIVSPARSPVLLFPLGADTRSSLIQGTRVSTEEVSLEIDDADALMGWHDNAGYLATHLLGITAPAPWAVFYQAIVEAGLQRHLFFPVGSGLTAGYSTPWGYLEPDALFHDELLRARHKQAAIQHGWKKGIDRTGRLWSHSA